MNNLIFVEGIPGTGKSTTSQFIYEQMKMNGVEVIWYHEGLKDHIIWNNLDKYFNDDGYIEAEDFDKYADGYVKKYSEIVKDAKENNRVYIFDGNIFSGYMNVFFKSDCSAEKTLKYYKLLEEVMMPLNPLLIYLNTSRVREHTIETWEGRALWGKKVAINSYGKIPHVKRGGYTGDDILFEYINPINILNNEYYDRSLFEKLRFNIDERNYDYYQAEILKHLNLKYYKTKEDEKDINSYVGIYDNDKDKENMFVKIKNEKLVCDWGQMNMVLIYVGPNLYNLRSYPIYLKFVEENKKIIGIETFGKQCFRRAGCSFKRVENTKYEIRK